MDQIKSELKNQIEKRRTFAIISHPDAGKTTLTEKFLLYGGAINQAGSVKGKATARRRRCRTGWRSRRNEDLGYFFRAPVQLRGILHQYPGHSGTSGFFRGYLPDADGGGFGGDGHRRLQGCGGPDPQIIQSMYHAPHSHFHFHQQDGSGG